MKEKFLDERTRAEDILLGSLGIDADATIVEVCRSADGYTGLARWSDGEEFSFESDPDDELAELEMWAVDVLNGQLKKTA